MSSECRDCAGTGKYTGFLTVDTCGTCRGTGRSSSVGNDSDMTIELTVDTAATWADEAVRHYWLDVSFIKRNGYGFPIYSFTGAPHQLRRFMRWCYVEKSGFTEAELESILQSAGLS